MYIYIHTYICIHTHAQIYAHMHVSGPGTHVPPYWCNTTKKHDTYTNRPRMETFTTTTTYDIHIYTTHIRDIYLYHTYTCVPAHASTLTYMSHVSLCECPLIWFMSRICLLYQSCNTYTCVPPHANTWSLCDMSHVSNRLGTWVTSLIDTGNESCLLYKSCYIACQHLIIPIYV